MIGSGNNLYQLLDVEDLCQVIVACMKQDKKKVNDTFNVGASEYSTMRQDYQAVLDEAGFGKRIVPFPEKLVVIALKVLEKMHLSPLYPWIYETAAKDSFVSSEKAERILGFKPKHSNQAAMLRNYRWYLRVKDQLKESSGSSHRLAWKQKILKLMKKFF